MVINPTPRSWSGVVLETRKSGTNTESERKERTHFYLGRESGFYRAYRGVWSQKQPCDCCRISFFFFFFFTINSICITHMWQRMLPPYWAGEMQTSAGTGGLVVVFGPVCRSEEPVCHQGESVYLNLIWYTFVQTRTWKPFTQIIFENPHLKLTNTWSWERSLLTLASPEKAVKSPDSSCEKFLKKKNKKTFIVIFTLSEISQVLHSQNRNSKINPTRKIYVAFLYIINIYLHT